MAAKQGCGEQTAGKQLMQKKRGAGYIGVLHAQRRCDYSALPDGNGVTGDSGQNKRVAQIDLTTSPIAS